MPRSNKPRPPNFCEICGASIPLQVGRQSKSCSDACHAERIKRKSVEYYNRVKGTVAWQETHAAYVRQLRARKAADADFAEVFRAYARQVVRRSREKFNADPIKRADLLTKKRLYAALFRAEIKKDPAALERHRQKARDWYRGLSDEDWMRIFGKKEKINDDSDKTLAR